MIDFDKIARDQGWGDFSQLSIIRDFVESIGKEEALIEYAKVRAEAENNGD